MLWWGVSNSIPMADGEDAPIQLELYTGELVPAAVFTVGSDGLLYLGKLRFRPLNADVWELVSRLEPQPEAYLE